MDWIACANQVKTQMWKKIFKNNDLEKWIRVVQLVLTNFFYRNKEQKLCTIRIFKTFRRNKISFKKVKEDLTQEVAWNVSDKIGNQNLWVARKFQSLTRVDVWYMKDICICCEYSIFKEIFLFIISGYTIYVFVLCEFALNFLLDRWEFSPKGKTSFIRLPLVWKKYLRKEENTSGSGAKTITGFWIRGER